MSARYRVPVSDDLLATRPWLHVAGFTLVSVDGPWLAHPGMTICTFDDDDAPASLEGKLVEPVLTRQPFNGIDGIGMNGVDIVTVTSRREVTS